MSKKIKLIVIIAIAIAGFLIWNSFFVKGDFETGYAQLEAIQSRYGVDAEVLVPGESAALAGFESELRAFKSSLGSSENGRALGLLADSRLHLVNMEQELLQAGARTAGFNPFNPNCTAIAEVNEKFDSAIASAMAALGKRQEFAAGHLAQAKSAGIGRNGDFKSAIDAIIGSIEKLKAELGSYC